MKKTKNDLITGKAIYPVSSDDLRVLLSETHSVLRLTAEPGEAVEEFMKRAFNDALSIEHVAQSTWQCIIYISPKWKKLSEDAINELENYIDRWCMNSEKRVSWGVYEDTSLHSPEILVIDNMAADTVASDDKCIVNNHKI
jgi:cell division GTPase FtsZ